MKADLYTAEARSAGSGGLAHRTAAGFVVLTGPDGDDMIALIDDKQNDSDLIDQVVSKAQADAPSAFAMLFTAGGELYVIASGLVTVSIASSSANLSVSAAKGKVLVHQLSAGISETAANIRMHTGDIPDDAVTELDLQAGTVQADWAEIAIGGATIAKPADSTPDARPAQPSEAEDPPAASSVPVEPVPETVETPAAPEPPTPPTAAPPEPPTPPPVSEPPTPPTPPTAAPPEPPTPPPVSEPPTPPTPPTAAPPEPPTPPTAAPPEPPTPPAPELPAQVERVSEPDAPSGSVSPVMVLGISCSQGHHNHPDAVYCSQCGTKMGVHHTTVLMNGPRPPLGVLVVDDGTTYSLNADLVIGREPTSHEDVIAGTATPVVLTDDTLSLSRRHARIVLDDWSVAIQDLNSSNGTFLSRAGQAETWTQLQPEVSTSLEPGDRLRIGGRIIQVELHHVR